MSLQYSTLKIWLNKRNIYQQPVEDKVEVAQVSTQASSRVLIGLGARGALRFHARTAAARSAARPIYVPASSFTSDCLCAVVSITRA